MYSISIFATFSIDFNSSDKMSTLKKYDSFENLKNSKEVSPSKAKSSTIIELEQFFKNLQQKIFRKDVSTVKPKNA